MSAAATLPAPDTLCALAARELAERYATHELSPLEVLDAVLARVETVDPMIDALFWRLDETAREAARASEARWLNDQPLSRLDGVPFTAKDNLDVAGVPTYWGSATAVDAPPASGTDALVDATTRAGAILFAKTAMVETGLFAASFSGLYGPVRNPWNMAMSASGSTSGGAAAAAAHLGPLHLGTDGGGSLRGPAAMCGCVGLKPTAHVPPFGDPPGEVPASRGLRGFITRDVADHRFVLDELTGADHSPSPPTALRVAYLSHPADDPGIGDIQAPVSAAVGAAVELLSGAAGMEIVEEPAPVFVGPLWEAAVLDAFARVARSLAELPAQRASRAHPVVRAVAERAAACAGDADAPGVDVIGSVLEAAASRLSALFARYDVLLLACNFTASFDADLPWHPDAALIDRLGYGWAAGACPHFGWVEGGPPSVALPCGLDGDGVPVGLLIVGPSGTDHATLRVAEAIEEQLGFGSLH